MKLAHKLRDVENEVDIVPGVLSTLLSGVKVVDADYITILDKEGINIYEGKQPKLSYHKKQCSVGIAQKEKYGAFL